MGLGVMMALSTLLADWVSKKVSVPVDAYFGLLYLVLIFLGTPILCQQIQYNESQSVGEKSNDIKYAQAFGCSYLLVNHTHKQRKSRFGIHFCLLLIFSFVFVV